MPTVCKRLPPTEETLTFLSPFLAKEHIQKGIDDRWRSCYGNYMLLKGIRNGALRCYGVFELGENGEVLRFMGFELGCLDASGKAFEHHAFWDRNVPVKECLRLCQQIMKDEYAAEGTIVTECVCYVSEKNRAVRRLAFRYGCRDCGLRPDKSFIHNGEVTACREFRIDV